MQSQTFRSIYSTDDPEKIRPTSSHVSPAEAVIKDLVLRKTPLEDLMSGLEEIGNKQALSIIEKETMSNYSFSPQDSGGRPPPSFFIPREPEENHSSASLLYAPSLKEQGGTLHYPVQESGNKEESSPYNSSLQAYMETVFSYFPCLEWLNRPQEYY